eukprot:365026-Chlamydomonas_euryale.AAC.9
MVQRQGSSRAPTRDPTVCRSGTSARLSIGRWSLPMHGGTPALPWVLRLLPPPRVLHLLAIAGCCACTNAHGCWYGSSSSSSSSSSNRVTHSPCGRTPSWQGAYPAGRAHTQLGAYPAGRAHTQLMGCVEAREGSSVRCTPVCPSRQKAQGRGPAPPS